MNTATNSTTTDSRARDRQVAAVIRRLTRAPVTEFEAHIIARLAPGKHARWVQGSAKRFLRSIQGAESLTEAQRRWLRALWRQHGPR